MHFCSFFPNTHAITQFFGYISLRISRDFFDLRHKCHLAQTLSISYLRKQSPWERKTGVYRKFPYIMMSMNDGAATVSNAFFMHTVSMSHSPSGSVNSVVLSWEQIDTMAGLHGFVLEFSPVAIWEDEMFEMSPRHAMMAEVPKWLWMACSILKLSSCVSVLVRTHYTAWYFFHCSQLVLLLDKWLQTVFACKKQY